MLAIITTHPIQYYAPLFRLLHQRGIVPIKVFYTWGDESIAKHDPGFNKTVAWDIPLLEGYPYVFIKNTAKNPGSHHFKGIVNPDLIAQVVKLNPDAILVFGWAYDSHLKTLRYFKNKIPVYFRGDSTLLDEQPGLKNILRAFFLKWVYHHIDHAFYPGTNTKAYFKKFGLTENQLSFAPHAIDNERFGKPRYAEAQALRSKFNISPEDILILFAGKYEEKKNPLLLIEAFKKLGRHDCHLLFAGNGPLEDVMKQNALHAGKIHFIDFQNQTDMPILYQAADLFCLPSKGPGETWGLAVNEAMACGKAVLISDKSGCAVDLVKDDYNGAVFQNDNIISLTNALQRLIFSKKQLANYGENSRDMIKPWNFQNLAMAIEYQITRGQSFRE